MRYTKEIAERVAELIRTNDYTIADICKSVGIGRTTIYLWMRTKPDFKELVDAAKEDARNVMVNGAKRGLMRKLTGYEIKETQVITMPSGKVDENGAPIPKIKEIRTTTHHVPADTDAIIFTLTSLDPQHWKNRRTTSINMDAGKDNPFAKMDDEELNKTIARMAKKLRRGKPDGND